MEMEEDLIQMVDILHGANLVVNLFQVALIFLAWALKENARFKEIMSTTVQDFVSFSIGLMFFYN